MRQIVSVLLLFSVLASSTGFTLTKHFCGEELAHVAIGSEVKPCCGDDEKQDMPDDCCHSGCCHDELDQALLDDSQLDYQTLQLQPLAFFTVSVLAHFLRHNAEAPTVSPLWTAFHSPPVPGISVYLRVQSFLI